jgi:anti-sigma factor RsiW
MKDGGPPMSSSSTCRESIELMLEYLDGELSADVRARLEEHFGGCSPCEDFLKSYRATPNLCRKALARAMPGAVADRLTEFLRAEMNKIKG